MSYILDALRRAEAERDRGGVPGLHAQPPLSTVGRSSSSAARRGGRWAYAAGAGAVALLLAFFAWQAGQRAVTPPAVASSPVAATALATPPPSVERVPVATAPAPASAVENLPPARAVPTPPARRAITAAPAKRPASGEVATVVRGSADEVNVPGIAELPEAIRRELPAVSIGGSIYSTSPASRIVIVNGQLFHEGDALAPGLVLQQIRLKSAVLAYKGLRYGITF